MSNSQFKSDEASAELTGEGETAALKIRIPRASVNVDTSSPIRYKLCAMQGFDML